MIKRLEDRLGQWERVYGLLCVALAVAAGAQLASFFLYSYHFWLPPYPRLAETYAILCRDPFTHAVVGEPQVRHRILGPLIAYGVGLRGESGQVVLIAAVFGFLALLCQLLWRHLPSITAVLLTLLLATTPVATTSQTWAGYPDSLAHLAVLGCLMLRSRWATGLVMLLGMLADERCISTAPLILIWHSVTRSDQATWDTTVRAAGLSIAFAIWLGFYQYVQHEYVLHMPGYDNTSFLAMCLSGKATLTVGYLPGAAYYALRSAWLMPIIVVCGGLARGQAAFAGAVVLSTLLALLPGALVADHSRCMSICWPVILIAVLRLRAIRPSRLTEWVCLALLLNVFTPLYEVFSSGFYLRYPLVASLARLWVRG